MKSLSLGWLGNGKKHKKTISILSLLLMSQSAYALNRLDALDVSAGDDGKTRITLTLEEKSIITDFDRRGKVLEVNLLDSSVNPDLLGMRKLPNVGRLLNGLNVTKEKDDVSLTLSMKSAFGFDYYQTNNILTLELMPLVSSATNTPQQGKKKADNLSINFQDIPVRSVLQMVAEHNGFNLVVSDTVSGSLTLRLDDVPWRKALDTILNVKGLDKRQMGNILLVAPKAELDEQERLVLEKRRQERELASLTSEVLKINYANAEDLKNMLDGDEDGISLLSNRGSIAVDTRTNSLVIKELSENITVLKSLIASLDIPVEQVEIEARIVTVDEGTLDEIGVRWGIQKTHGNLTTGGSIDGIQNGNVGEEGETQIDDFLNVNLGSVNPNAGSIAFQVANLGKDLLLDLELSALQAESRAEIISSPRLLTTNKRAAYIEQGTELPYLEASSSGAAAVSFKKAVLSLSVTPQITHDNKLVLDLQVTQDKPGTTVKAGTGEAMAINTQRIGTQVLVNDGETIVLGGIYQHEKQNSVDKVPLLGDIPGIGRLFRRDYETMGKRELLIFVTPRIMIQ